VSGRGDAAAAVAGTRQAAALCDEMCLQCWQEAAASQHRMVRCSCAWCSGAVLAVRAAAATIGTATATVPACTSMFLLLLSRTGMCWLLSHHSRRMRRQQQVAGPRRCAGLQGPVVHVAARCYSGMPAECALCSHFATAWQCFLSCFQVLHIAAVIRMKYLFACCVLLLSAAPAQ
jgi:hypothetical protein